MKKIHWVIIRILKNQAWFMSWYKEMIYYVMENMIYEIEANGFEKVKKRVLNRNKVIRDEYLVKE